MLIEVILEVHWGLITQRTMESLAIVKGFDIVEDCLGGLSPGSELARRGEVMIEFPDTLSAADARSACPP